MTIIILILNYFTLMNTNKVVSTLKQIGTTAYNHKIKVTLGLFLLYGVKKGYDMYKFLKP